jgi:general L-amino acid transport system substrate-binding protein
MGGYKRAIAAGALGLAMALVGSGAAADPTVDGVKRRGELVCGVNGGLPGFSLFNAVKEWEGLDVDLCRAVAAAVLGNAGKVKFVPLTPQQRFDSLRSQAIDLLAANATITLQRVAGAALEFAVPNYYDGQAFVVAKKSNVPAAANLNGRTVCVLNGTTHAANLSSWYAARRLSVQPLFFDDQQAMYDAFFKDRCVGVTQDMTALAATVIRSGRAADYRVLPEVISKEPLGPYVRRGDEQWLNVVRWTQYAMVEAEELDVSRTNLAEQAASNDPAVQRLLGVTPGNGKALGLDERWAYNVISQVGNYGESFERNIGQRSPLKFARGINALWSRGGLMYPLPLR